MHPTLACVSYAASSDSAHPGGENRQYREGSSAITEPAENLPNLARQLIIQGATPMLAR